MLNLLDLPNEVLSQTATHAVSYSFAHSFLPRLTFFPSHQYACKKWYNVVSPIFYGNLSSSGKLHLSYNDLVYWPGKQTPIYHHYCDKLEKISIRLQGNPATRMLASIKTVFFKDSDQYLEDSDGNELGLADTANEHSDSASEDMEDHAPSDAESDDSMANLTRTFEPLSWKDDIAVHLPALSQLITDCPFLDEIVFQAYYGLDKRHQSQFDYLDCVSMERFLLRLPPNLKYLTLDLGGTDVVPSQNHVSDHLCPAIAQCILNVENVRLRLRHICPWVFGIKSIHSSNQQGSRQPSRQQRASQQPLQFVMHQDSRTAGASRLKSLVVRLSLPQFPIHLLNEGYGPYEVKRCRSFQASRNFGLPRVMALAARHLLAREPSIETLKISFKDPDPDPDSLIVYGIDCVDWKMLSVSEGKFCVEDCGEGWEDWENRIDLIRVQIPSPAETAQMAVDLHAFHPAGSTMTSDESSSEEDESSSEEDESSSEEDVSY